MTMKYPRFIQPRLKEALADTPVVLLNGSRQTGKTTLAQSTGGNKYHYVTLDDDTSLAAAKRDPRGFIEDLPQYCILDEIQHAPELFPSIKLIVDRDRTPGRFLLTGSANILAVPKLAESLAGRMEVIHLYPLSQAEIAGKKPLFLTMAFAAKMKGNFKQRLGSELFDRVLSGGYPEPLQRDSVTRQRAWYSSYLNVMIQKDITDFAKIQHSENISKILQRVANNTASLLNISELNKGLGVDLKTAKHYFDLLSHIFLVCTLPAWSNNRNKRLLKTAKMHITDTGLLGALLKLTKPQLEKDRTMMGPVLESFVYNELIKQASWQNEELQFFHYRDKDQYEVDIVILNENGLLVGVEIKLAASVSESDFKGLKRFKTQHPEKFVGGYILYDGERTLSFGDGLYAVPLQSLWLN